MRRLASLRFTEIISYAVALLTFYMYLRTGGGMIVMGVFIASLCVSMFIGTIPLKAYFYGPIIICVYVCIVWSRGGNLLGELEAKEFFAQLKVFLLNLTVIAIMAVNIFFLLFRAKTPFSLTLFNGYNLLLALAVIAGSQAQGGDFRWILCIIVVLVFADGFFINREAILDEFRKKKRAGREFISGITRGSSVLSYILFLIITAGSILCVSPPLYFFIEESVWAETGNGTAPNGTSPLRLKEHSTHDLEKNRPNPDDLRVKMTVATRYKGMPLKGLYMKGRDFDRYEWGGKWSIGRSMSTCRADEQGGIRIPFAYRRSVPVKDVFLTVRLLVLDSSEIFAPERPEYLFMPFSRMKCRKYLYGGLSFSSLRRDMVEYKVISTLPAAPADSMARLTRTGFISKIYNQVPHRMERIINTGKMITGQQLSVKRKIDRIKEYLAEQCIYTLEPVEWNPDRDPVEQFLFETKRGVCVNFASAFVLMARAAGIPARYCTGYMRQFPDQSTTSETAKGQGITSELYIIRYRNAHAWAEVFIEGAGWVTVETVPVSGMSLIMNMNGRNTPVSQQRVGNNARKTVKDDADKTPQSIADWAWSLIMKLPVPTVRWGGLAVGFILLAGVFLMRIPLGTYIRLLEAAGLKKKIITPVDFYNEFLIGLDKKGIRILPGETASEFVSRVPLPVPEKDGLFLTDQYYRTRYGHSEITDPDRIRDILGKME